MATTILEPDDIQKEVMLRLEKDFQATRDDVNSLKAGYNVIQRDMTNLMSNIDKLVTRFEESRKTNWPLLALMSGLLPLVIGGMGFFITSYTAGAMSPIQAQIVQEQTNLRTVAAQVAEIATTQNNRGREISLMSQQATANSEVLKRLSDSQARLQEQVFNSAAADVNSRTDRAQLNDRIKKMEELVASEVAERRSQSAETRVHLGEIEQQFHSVSNLENLRAAQQERLNAMMWEKAHPGERYPNGTFFPTSIFQGAGGAVPMVNNSLE